MSRLARPAMGGIGLALVAVACFAAYDTSAKLVSAVVPLVLALWVRYLAQAALALHGLVRGPGAGRWQTRHRGLHLARAVAALGCNVFSFLSFKHLPVAEVTAILMLTPALMTVFAAHGLGEPVSALQWALVGLGFGGALLVVQPGGEQADARLLLPLALLLANTGFQALTSRLVRSDPPSLIQAHTSAVGLLSLSLALPWAWTGWPGPGPAALLLLMAACATCGHHLLVLAYARAAASRVTPFLYFQLVFAALAGWLVFGQVPDGAGMAGIACIAFSGVASSLLPRQPLRAAGLSRR